MTDLKNGNDGDIPLEETVAFAGQLSKFLNGFYQLRAENEKLKEENRAKDAKIDEQHETIESPGTAFGCAGCMTSKSSEKMYAFFSSGLRRRTISTSPPA